MTANAGGTAGPDREPARTASVGPAGPVSYLRVYQPLAAFEMAERAHWQAYAAAAASWQDPQVGVVRERAASLRALIGRPGHWSGVPQPPREAFLLGVDGVTLICPWQTELRCWHALTEVREGLPIQLADTWTSPSAAATAVHRLAATVAGESAPVIHLRLRGWTVPTPWFVLVQEQERLLQLGPRRAVGATAAIAGTERYLRYRTAMSQARRRNARALEVLRRRLGASPLTAEVEGVGRWLEEFHPRSWVEVDYGGLVHLLSDDQLQEQTCATDVAEALTALGEGDEKRAASAYRRVTARMSGLLAIEGAS